MKIRKIALFLLILILSINSYAMLAIAAETQDVPNYFEELSPRISGYLRVNMSFENEDDIFVSGRAAPDATIRIYDVSDIESQYDFQDGDYLSDSVVQEVIHHGIYVGALPVEGIRFSGTIRPSINRQKYTFVAVAMIPEDESWEYMVVDAATVVILSK